jgi:predicted phosphoribosyltransferase/dienelactone hydrolase
MTVFADRREAGRLLAAHIRDARLGDAVIVGLARGGVVVAAAVAGELGQPLDAVAVRKVRHPLQPEYALGAVAPGVVYVRPDADVPRGALDAAAAEAEADARALDRRLHMRGPPAALEGRTCVLVDDGLATGATMEAAIRWARGRGASRVVVAVPVGPAGTLAALGRDADLVLAVEAPETIFAVSEWYAEFGEVPEAEVAALLAPAATSRSVTIGADGVQLEGDLALPRGALGVVVFAHGSGSSRSSPRNRAVAERLNAEPLATLLFDLLTRAEGGDRAAVFDIELLAERLAAATRWLASQPETSGLAIGYFGASTGAAAALSAAAANPAVRAVVSRGGRPDLAGAHLGAVRAPTLLVVGGRDEAVLEMNRRAANALRSPAELVVVPGATHLFEETGALEQVADLAAGWFRRHLTGGDRPA